MRDMERKRAYDRERMRRLRAIAAPTLKREREEELERAQEEQLAELNAQFAREMEAFEALIAEHMPEEYRTGASRVRGCAHARGSRASAPGSILVVRWPRTREWRFRRRTLSSLECRSGSSSLS